MPERFDVLIVGAGHGGAQAAIMLRQLKFEGSIALIGDEPELPYERPPLSKDYLAGEKPFERLLIRPPAFWRDRDVTLLPGRDVVGVDASAKTVATAAGETFAYRALIWATGGKPRRLTCEGGDRPGVHTIRERRDVDALKAELAGARRVAVIGGGYIGLEAAAVLSKLGKPVTVLEALPRVLARVAGEPLSRVFQAEHRAHGVEIRTGVSVERLTDAGVSLSGGELVPADLVIVGIGITPAVAPLLAAGADGGDGIEVDAQCRASLPDIYAIGDCARHANRFADGERVRLESVQNANDQATVAARAIAGEPAAYDAVPWFWSNQYDLKLQTVGLSRGHDAHVVRGAPESRSFSVIYLRAGRVIALDCVNATKDYVQGRALVLAGAAIAPERLADPETPLKQLSI